MARRQREWPHAMTTLTTHDTKRGEDVRARITVLAEVPGDVGAALDAAARAGARCPTRASATCCGRPSSAPGRPGRRRTARRPARAAARRTPRRRCARPATAPPGPTPTTAYEAAVHAAVDAALDDPAGARPWSTGWSTRLADAGWSNALAAKLVAITAPGVCDVYQGSELWEQSLVDPDNRRPVDFDRRAALLRDRSGPAGRPGRPRGPTTRARPSCWVTATALRLRRDRPELFTGYAALDRARVRPPTTCWPSTAAVRSRSPPGCPSGWPRAAAGATRR